MHEFEVLIQDFLKWGIKDINPRFPQVRNNIFNEHTAVESERNRPTMVKHLLHIKMM